jgi:hypothetical protein
VAIQQLEPGFDGVVQYREQIMAFVAEDRSVTETLVLCTVDPGSRDARLATEESYLPCLSLPVLRWRAERIENAARAFIHDPRARH